MVQASAARLDVSVPVGSYQGLSEVSYISQVSNRSGFVSRSVRLLSLLQALRGRRRPVTAAELARTLEVSERTIYRDVAPLAAHGATIQGEGGVRYILRHSLFPPPLMLSEDETEAVLLGLRYVDQCGDQTHP